MSSIQGARYVGQSTINVIKPYYGDTADRELTRLLREHILGAVPVLLAAKAGDKAKLAAAQKTWYADAIASFLAKANPRYWPLPAVRSMMHMHLALTTREAAARLQGRWTADIAAYDAVHRQILEMADALSEGIIRQFPNRF